MMRKITKECIQNKVHPITKLYRVGHLDLHTSIFSEKWYVEWRLAGTKSLDQNAGASVFSDGTFTELYPSESKQQVPGNMSVNDFCNDVGIPEKLTVIRPQSSASGTMKFLNMLNEKE